MSMTLSPKPKKEGSVKQEAAVASSTAADSVAVDTVPK
jgi:hypothetical protein